MKIQFNKTGKEIKLAINKRREYLQQNLDRYNAVFNEFMRDARKVRSYLIRSSHFYAQSDHKEGDTLYNKTEMSSDERQYIDQLCLRIFQSEQELQKLVLMVIHLEDTRVFELTFAELIEFGFEPSMATE